MINAISRLFRLGSKLAYGQSNPRGNLDGPAEPANNGRFAALEEENRSLWAQLTNVGLELQAARARLQSYEAKPTEDPFSSAYRNRVSLILLPRLLDLLPQSDRFTIVDAGAREVDRDPRWRPFPPNRLRFVGFEPDATEAARLNASPSKDGIEWQFVAAGLWGSTGTLTFEHNNIGGGSSFLPQNRQVTDRWKFENPHETALARNIFFPTRHEAIQVISLADWSRDSGIDGIDFIKLNVQGGELEILSGAGPLLDTVLGLLVEVAFVESYCGRPMFADLDRFLRSRGFTFFDLLAHHYVGRAEAPIAAQHLTVSEPKLGQLVSAWGQLVEGHALYLRDPLAGTIPELTPARSIKLAGIAETFGQVEYAFELLNWSANQFAAADGRVADGMRAAVAEAATEYGRLHRSHSAA